jgi:hypothetical protein
LYLKGAVWGGIGGLFIGAALGERRYTTAQLLLAINLALAASFVGYIAINEPKLVYFSGHGLDAPRQEGWAGLWCFYLALLALAARMRDRTAVRFSVAGMLGCGAGFALGWVAFRLGTDHFGSATVAYIDWWKVAECTCGLIGGMALGWASIGCARSPEHELPTAPATAMPAWVSILLVLDLLLLFRLADKMGDLGGWLGAAPFVFVAPAIVLAMHGRPAFQLLVGAAMPIVLALSNVQYEWAVDPHLMSVPWSTASLVLLAVIAAVHVVRNADHPRRLLLLIAWTCTACAWAKYAYPPPKHRLVMIGVQGLLTLMACWLTIYVHDRRPAGVSTQPSP